MQGSSLAKQLIWFVLKENCFLFGFDLKKVKYANFHG